MTTLNIKKTDIKAFDENNFKYMGIYLEAYENNNKEVKKRCIHINDWETITETTLKPLYVSKKNQEIFNTTDKFKEPNGIAILTELSNISVIDVDEPENCEILDKLMNDCNWIHQTRKGFHFIFKKNDLPRKKTM